MEKKKTYLIENKNEKITDFITHILDSEKIPYKLKPIKVYHPYSYFFAQLSQPIITGYDIEIYTDEHHFAFFNRIMNQRLALELSFNKPSITIPQELNNTIKTFVIENNIKVQSYDEWLKKNSVKPKKSILKKIIGLIEKIIYKTTK